MSKIQAREYYLEKLKETQEPRKKLAEANLGLILSKERELDDKMQELQDSKAEWINEKKEAEENLSNPDPAILRMLERDFYAEVSQRRRGGDPQINERMGGPQYGIKTQGKNRRKVLVPKRKWTEDNKDYFQNEETEIEEIRDNQGAYEEWLKYMERGLDIQKDWDFEKLFKEIEKFFNNAPSLDKYGPTRTIFVSTGEEYNAGAK